MGMLARSLKGFLHHWSGVTGLGIVVIFLAMGFLAPYIAPHDPLRMHPDLLLRGPSAAFPLGTDEFGRCIFSRLLHSLMIPFKLGIPAVFLAGFTGTLMGLGAGYGGGKFDTISMRFSDALVAFPPILLAIMITVIMGRGAINAVLALGIVKIPQYARLTRGQVLSIKETSYVEAARAAGGNSTYILSRSILPNLVPILIVQSTITFAALIILEAALSFLGLGVPLPTPSLGKMLSVGRGYMSFNPWYVGAPALAIVTLILSTYLFGDGLRDALDPQHDILT